MHRNRYLFLVFALLCVALTQLAPAQDLQASWCYQSGLSEQILWTTSGAWAEDGLVVVDQLDEQVRQYAPNGVMRATLEARILATGVAGDRKLGAPAQIRETASGYLLFNDNDLRDDDPTPAEIIKLDERLEALPQPIKVEGRELGSDGTLAAIFDWAPMGEGILAFGDLRLDDDVWESAFLYFDESGRHQVFERIDSHADVVNHYTAGTMPYIATLDDVGYILFMNEIPFIGEVRLGVPGVRRLESFPEEFRNAPRLATRPDWARARKGDRQATLFFEILEASTMAAGLYAHGGELYLLGKSAAKQLGPTSSTSWWMIGLDPADGRELSRAKLPTNAAHLTIVPGDFWALIEKDPVQGIGKRHAPYMETSSMVLVPSRWISVAQARQQVATGASRSDCLTF